MATKKTKSTETLVSVAFKIHPDHKAVIEAACELEAARIGRPYGLAEYFRDSAMHFASKAVGGKVTEYEYTRGRPAKVA